MINSIDLPLALIVEFVEFVVAVVVVFEIAVLGFVGGAVAVAAAVVDYDECGAAAVD